MFELLHVLSFFFWNGHVCACMLCTLTYKTMSACKELIDVHIHHISWSCKRD